MRFTKPGNSYPAIITTIIVTPNTRQAYAKTFTGTMDGTLWTIPETALNKMRIPLTDSSLGLPIAVHVTKKGTHFSKVRDEPPVELDNLRIITVDDITEEILKEFPYLYKDYIQPMQPLW